MVVELRGRVDVDTAEAFRSACLRELKGQRIVFDFSSLSFVGSQGILPFLESLQAFYQSNPGGFKLSGVGLEFRKVFSATPLSALEIYDLPDQAVSAFHAPVAAAQLVPLVPISFSPTEFIAYRETPPAPSPALEDDFTDELDA